MAQTFFIVSLYQWVCLFIEPQKQSNLHHNQSSSWSVIPQNCQPEWVRAAYSNVVCFIPGTHKVTKYCIIFSVVGSGRCSNLSLDVDIFQTPGSLETLQYGMPLNLRNRGLVSSPIPQNACLSKAPKMSVAFCSPDPISTMSPMEYSDAF